MNSSVYSYLNLGTFCTFFHTGAETQLGTIFALCLCAKCPCNKDLLLLLSLPVQTALVAIHSVVFCRQPCADKHARPLCYLYRLIKFTFLPGITEKSFANHYVYNTWHPLTD